MNLKRRFYRLIIRIRKKFKKKVRTRLDSKPGLTELQRKMIMLWDRSLKDKSSKLYCTFLSTHRQIETNRVLLILTPSGHDLYYMTVIDTSGQGNCYEISFRTSIGVELGEMFDNETEKRMRLLEFSKREVITRDLESLLSE